MEQWEDIELEPIKNQTKPLENRTMQTETFLNEINWTGLTLAELCEAGRMTRETVKRWIDESRNAELESLDFEGVENHDWRAELEARIHAVNEISKKFHLQ